MSKVVGWIKSHKLTFVLVIFIFYLLIKQSTPNYLMRSSNFIGTDYSAKSIGSTQDGTMMSKSVVPPSASYSKTGAPTSDRMVVADSYLSLVVKKVEDTHRQILKKAQELGGFMINSSINNPHENANASLTVRIPNKQLEAALKFFKSLSVKAVTENLTGEDVTNQYTDIETRLATLNKTKTIFEDMLNKAITIEDILNVQREILNIQDQIDTQIGQKKYLAENVNLAKITVYLSTDELSLPYAPLDSWRPEQILKEAVRSMISTLRLLIGFLIWIGVYAAIWIPVLLIFLFLRKRFFKKAN